MTRLNASRVIRAGLLYAALTGVLAFPLSIHPASAVISDAPDTNLYLWTLAWDTHAFAHQPLSIFDANIYYPERDTLAYSENLIGSAIFAAPVIWLTGNLVLAMNLVALLSCALCGVGAYLLARRVGASETGGLLAGVVFALAPPRFLRLDQLHLTTIQWVPFALSYLHVYLAEGGARNLRLFFLFGTLQALTSGHGAVFLLVASIVIVAYRTALGEPVALRRRAQDFGWLGILIVLPAILLFVPYRQAQLDIGLRRGLDDGTMSAASLLASPSHVHVWLLGLFRASWINDSAQAYLFPGFVALILTSAALVTVSRSDTVVRFLVVLVEGVGTMAIAVSLYVTVIGPIRLKVGASTVVTVRHWLRPWLAVGLVTVLRLASAFYVPLDPRPRLARWARAHRHDIAMTYAAIALICLWLANSSLLSLWRLVYWLPIFNFIRVPSRFMLLALLAVSVLAALGFDRLTKGAVRKRPLRGIVVGALLVAEYAVAPLETSQRRVDIPRVDRWIAGRSDVRAIAEFPMDPGNERLHTIFMLHSTAHWRKTIEGYSGIRPLLHERLYPQLVGFPDHQSLAALDAVGVTHVVVHTDLYRSEDWPAVEARFQTLMNRLTLEHADGDGRVYSIRP